MSSFINIKEKLNKNIKKGATKMLKKAIIILAVSNILDGILTYIGVKSGYMEEANPLMIEFVENPFFVIIVKIIGVPLILYILFKKIKKHKIQSKLNVTLPFFVATTFYLFVMFLHFSILFRVFVI